MTSSTCRLWASRRAVQTIFSMRTGCSQLMRFCSAVARSFRSTLSMSATSKRYAQALRLAEAQRGKGFWHGLFG